MSVLEWGNQIAELVLYEGLQASAQCLNRMNVKETLLRPCQLWRQHLQLLIP